jgi:hypothetical protein
MQCSPKLIHRIYPRHFVAPTLNVHQDGEEAQGNGVGARYRGTALAASITVLDRRMRLLEEDTRDPTLPEATR